MAERGVWLVPTHYVYRDFVEKVEAGTYGPKVSAAVRDMVERSRDLLPIALEHGVRIALGSDAFGSWMHGNNLRELHYLHEAGMPVAEVLLTATRHGAELCGVDDSYGRIAPGFVFDAILVDSDPSDPAVFLDREVVKAVFKGGELETCTLPQLQPALV
jgi:imidazolonepropionase-like amidohydrolase